MYIYVGYNPPPRTFSYFGRDSTVVVLQIGHCEIIQYNLTVLCGITAFLVIINRCISVHVQYIGIFGVCSTDLRLDTSTNDIKHVYTSPEAIQQKTYFINNVHLKILYNFQKKRFCLKEIKHLKMAFYLPKWPIFKNLQYFSN